MRPIGSCSSMGVRYAFGVLLVASFVSTPAAPSAAQTTRPIGAGAQGSGVLFVDASATGSNDGASWADAFVTLQDALAEAAARNGDKDALNDITEIWVAAGTYYPDEGGGQTPGDRTATFQLLNGVALYGGFAGNETLLSQRDIEANPIVLSGDLDGDDAPVACVDDSPDCDDFGGLCGDDGFCIIADNNDENSYHVATGSGTDATAILDGFTVSAGNASGGSPNNVGAGMYDSSGSPTVTNCTFDGNSASNGGGMYNTGSSSPTVSNCTFSGNTAVNSGGGMYNISSSPTVTNCTFSGNSASDVGGGMYNQSSSPTVTNCTFSGNSANFGGGMYNFLGNPSVTNCTFSGNSALGSGSGGGMFNDNTSPTVTNCTFSGNTAVNSGGGMWNGGSPTVVNCTFSGNSANFGGGMYNSTSSPTVANCIFRGNSDSGGMDESAQIHTSGGTPTVNYSIVQGGWTGAGGTGNLASDPLFIDPDGPDNIIGTADDNVRIAAGSPVIDAGDNSAVPADIADLDGDLDTAEPTPLDLDLNERFVDDPNIPDTGNGTAPIVDIGAFEFQASVVFVDESAIGANNGSSWADAYLFLQDALDEAAGAGGAVSEIWVAAGTYRPDQGGGQTPGDRFATFQLVNGVALYGGFAGTETAVEQRDVDLNETILSGDLSADDAPVACTGDSPDSPDCDSFGGLCVDGFCIIADNNDENSFHVVTGSGTDGTAILDGFVVTGGNANAGFPDNTGAGMNNDTGSPIVTNCTFRGNSAVRSGAGISNESSSNPTVTNCTFSGNRAGLEGGGTYNSASSSPMVSNCTFSRNSAGDGGGMVSDSSSPMVSNCTFSRNSADSAGGGMLNKDFSSPNVTNCTFDGNSAGSGGGMANTTGSSPTLTNCTFSGNSVGASGGGLFCSSSSPTVTNCTFSGNSASDNGGGMHNNSGSSPTLTNCTFSGNSATFNGGGMYNISSSPTVTNCTFSGNSAGSVGGGMRNIDSSPTLINSIFWGNSDSGGMDESAQIHTGSGTPAVNYSVVQGGWSGAGGVGIVASDPLFVDADGADNIPGTEDDDLRLQSGSPAIDAADTTALPLDTLDLDNDGDTAERIPIDLAGNPRVLDDLLTTDTGVAGSPVVDMGAYEFFRDCDNSGVADSMEIAEGTSQDCNGNGISDACDITDCAPGNKACGDCNLNGIPDLCDVPVSAGCPTGACLASCSLDDDEDCVPDDCISPNTGGIAWDDPIWNQDNDYPDSDPTNPNGIPNQHVVLDGVNLLLNVTVEIDTLLIESDASLCMNGGLPCGALTGASAEGSDELNDFHAAATTGDLFIAESGGVLVEGELTIGDGLTLTEPEINDAGLTLAEGGVVRVNGSTIDLSGNAVLQNGGLYHADPVDETNTATMTTDNITLWDDETRNDLLRSSEIDLSGAMQVSSKIDLRVGGGGTRPIKPPPTDDTIRIEEGGGGAAPPPSGLASDAALCWKMAPILRAKNSAFYDVGGDFTLVDAACIEVGSPSPRFGAGMKLAGKFENQGTRPTMFDWSTGYLTLDGSAEQLFEVGGKDFGRSREGLSTQEALLDDCVTQCKPFSGGCDCSHGNYSMGKIDVGTTGVPANVRFVNRFANTVGIGPCREALYVDTLTLETGSTVTVDDVIVYYDTLVDLGATILKVGCGDLIPLCFPSTPSTLQVQFDPVANAGAPEEKNRVIAINAGDVGHQQAIRVTWEAMPNWAGGHTALVGQTKWMLEPFQVCENSGEGFGVSPPDCSNAPGQPQKWFWAARLTCTAEDAHFSDMSKLTDYCTGSGEACTTDEDCAQGACDVDGAIHLLDQGFGPSKNANQQSIYSVQVIESVCTISSEDNYSDALVVTNPLWGDIGNGTSCPMAPPNGVADLVPDVTRALSKFSNNFCAPKKTRADVGPDVLDMNVGIADVLHLLNAFASGSQIYPFEAGPDCAPAREQ